MSWRHAGSRRAEVNDWCTSDKGGSVVSGRYVCLATEAGAGGRSPLGRGDFFVQGLLGRLHSPSSRMGVRRVVLESMNMIIGLPAYVHISYIRCWLLSFGVYEGLDRPVTICVVSSLPRVMYVWGLDGLTQGTMCVCCRCHRLAIGRQWLKQR
jgi:hypothetical protein